MVTGKALDFPFELATVKDVHFIQNKRLTFSAFCLVLAFLWFGIQDEINAKDLRVQGEVYPIREQNALTFIQERLINLQASGELSRAQEILKAKTVSSLERPHPVKGLKPTQTPRTFEKAVSVQVQADIRDAQGTLIYKAGAKVNPLSTQTCSKMLVFLDATSPKQWDWALKRYQKSPEQTKLVLVNGPVLALMRTFQIPLYFDQAGRLVEYFQIQQVPALVSQSQDKLYPFTYPPPSDKLRNPIPITLV